MQLFQITLKALSLRFAVFAIALLGITPASASAQTDVTPDLGSTVPGSFYTDRYEPASFELTNGFQGRNDVLQIGIDASTDAANRGGQGSTFYNTQGRKTDVNTLGSWTFTSDLFVHDSWRDSGNGFVRTDMWATATNDAGFATPVAYPIIGFVNYGPYIGFRGYNGAAGIWVQSLAPVLYGQWNTLSISFDDATDIFSYYINGAFQSSFGAPVGGASGVSDVMYQAYNFNDPDLGISGNPDYLASWSNTPGGVDSTVPEPATMTLLATGLAGMAAARRRKKK
jgi:hypothetical protein